MASIESYNNRTLHSDYTDQATRLDTLQALDSFPARLPLLITRDWLLFGSRGNGQLGPLAARIRIRLSIHVSPSGCALRAGMMSVPDMLRPRLTVQAGRRVCARACRSHRLASGQEQVSFLHGIDHASEQFVRELDVTVPDTK